MVAAPGWMNHDLHFAGPILLAGRPDQHVACLRQPSSGAPLGQVRVLLRLTGWGNSKEGAIPKYRGRAVRSGRPCISQTAPVPA